MARILIGVSGGIAAYKAVELTRLAIRAGHSVRVLATPSVERFVGRATFEGITGAPVLVSEFDPDPLRGSFPGDSQPTHLPIGHLELAERADAFVIAPASANTLAKLAIGICDSALTTAFCAREGPCLIAPAMNDRMWRSAATRENVERLRDRGVEVVEPGQGELASRGEYGLGRLAEPGDLLAAIGGLIGASSPAPARNDASLSGQRVLVTAGGTREAIDPVRFLGNRSSGRMGLALAEAARDRGADVTLIAANVNGEKPGGVRVREVESTEQLATACREEAAVQDIVIMAAAPADFRPERASEGKLRRSGEGLSLSLVPTPDILAELAGNRREDQLLVGFAAEAGGDALGSAREKLERKGVDLIVLNDVSDRSIGFDSEQNAVTLVSDSDEVEIGRRPKREVAEAILDRILAGF